MAYHRTRARARRHRYAIPIAALAGMLGVAAPVPAFAAESGAPQASDPPRYVGSATCAPCHAAEVAAWRASHHQQAMQPASPQTVLGDFNDAAVTHFGVTTRFFKRGDAYVVRTDGPGGALADFPVRHTFGVFPLQQYLIELAGGRLQALTLAWDARAKADGGQRWFSLYPGDAIRAGDPLHWTGSEQNWNYMCADCHSTHVQKRYDAGAHRYDTVWSEIDVGCEACHGPASRHLDQAAQQPAGTAPADPNMGLVVSFPTRSADRWTIDPATGNARPRPAPLGRIEVETCAPCHARRSVIGSDHAPGQPLLDTYVPALLIEGLYHADGQIDGEVYEYGSFLQSKMYGRGVTCSDCHEPHGLTLRADGNALCAQCHAPAKYDRASHHFHPPGSPGATCVGCHMPTKTYMGVDVRRDHGLRVPRPDLSLSLGVPNPCAACHADRDADWARAQVRRWYGHDPSGFQQFAPALHAARRDTADAPALLTALAANRSQPAIARATALAMLRNYPTAQPPDAVRAALGDEDPAVRRAALAALDPLTGNARVALAAPLLGDPVRAVRIEAARALAAMPATGLSDALRLRIDRGVDEYIAAQRLDADRPEAHTDLGMLYADRGRLTDAEAELRHAIALRADYTPAYVDLADVLRVEQRDRDGERVLRDGLAAVPDDAALHHALGLLLVRLRRVDEGVAELQRAAALRPDDPRFSYVLGVALNSVGNVPLALQTLEAAHQRRPGDRNILAALVAIHRDNGHVAEATRYAQELAALPAR